MAVVRTQTRVNSSIDELYTLLAGLEGDIDVDLTALFAFDVAIDARVDTAETNIGQLQFDLSDAEGRIATLEGNPKGHIIENEGTPLTQRNNLNFVGAGVTAADSGGKTVVTIAGGGGGGATATTIEVEINLGWQGKFFITDAAIEATSKVLVWQAPGPYTGKGTLTDEGALAPMEIRSVAAGAGVALVYWESPIVHSFGQYRTAPGDMGRVNATAGVGALRREHEIVSKVRRGLIKGNVKFTYVVFG